MSIVCHNSLFVFNVQERIFAFLIDDICEENFSGIEYIIRKKD